MANYKRLVIVVLFAFSQVAHAGFSSMRPPPGYSKTGQQPGWGPSYKPAPGEFYDLGKQKWMTTAQLNTGGRDLTVPVAMPLATGVNVGLAVASAFSSNPAILLGTAAWALYQAYLSQKKITPNSDGTFEQVQDGLECASNCFEYQIAYSNTAWYKTAQGAFDAWKPAPTASDTYSFVSLSADGVTINALRVNRGREWVTGVGYQDYVRQLPFTKEAFRRSIPPWNTSKTIAVTPQQVATEMAQLPMTKPLIDALPMPLPVNPPVINPDPSTGQPKVLRLPQGSPSPVPLPVPNPDNLPQSWKTPVVDVIPSPTPDDPWRVETIPKDIIKTDPTPITDPLNPNAPGPTPVTPPDTDPGTSEQAKQPGLCDEYPDILACAKPVLDTPPADEFKNKTVTLAIVKDEGWGPASAACPAPKTATIMGVSLSMPFTLICEVAGMINPLLIGFAWLSAAFTFIGIGRRD